MTHIPPTEKECPMTERAKKAQPAPDLDLQEILRQSFAGLAPNDPLAQFLDRLEGRK
jgi:hypothetical protein